MLEHRYSGYLGPRVCGTILTQQLHLQYANMAANLLWGRQFTHTHSAASDCSIHAILRAGAPCRTWDAPNKYDARLPGAQGLLCTGVHWICSVVAEI